MTCHPDGFRRATFGVATRLFYDALLEDAAGVAANTEVLDLACGPGLPTVTGGWSTVCGTMRTQRSSWRRSGRCTASEPLGLAH